MIPVTKPFLPPTEEFKKYIDAIWQRAWLTNNGPLVNELELELKRYLGIDYLLFLSNGTIAIQLAIKALELSGEIITTPFSYVATTSSIVWENCTPIFVDIDAETFNIDATKIEAAISPDTSAILATHVFGNPCEIDAIQAIADKHNIKVLYDAAHTFGVKYKEQSIFNYGDISTTSFHATKLFHTTEGGAVMTPHAELLQKMALLRNFGHTSATTFGSVGINAKNSELHAAMGLCNLNYIEDILEKRKEQSTFYSQLLANTTIRTQKITAHTTYNYAYYPILLEDEEMTLKLIRNLGEQRVYPRRYFYPSLSSLNYVKPQKTPVSDDIAHRVLCLPLYQNLSLAEIEMIVRIVKRTVKY